MKICLLKAMYDRRLNTTEMLFATYWHVSELANSLAELGHDVSIVQAFADSQGCHRDGVRVFTQAAQRPGRAGNAFTVEISDFSAALGTLDKIAPDVVHLFGMTLERPLAALAKWCAGNGVALTVSFHGGKPRRNPFGAWWQRRLFRYVSIAFFSAPEYAEQWRAARIIGKGTRVVLAAELSSPFSGIDQGDARRRLNITGGPVIAWAGRLCALKDPLTALRGFNEILARFPEAELLMAFQDDALLNDVESFLATSKALAERTRLLGKLEHPEMEVLFSAADCYVSTSRREYGSNTLVEAFSEMLVSLASIDGSPLSLK